MKKRGDVATSYHDIYPGNVRRPRLYADAHIPMDLIRELRSMRWKVKSVVEELGDGVSDDQVRRAAKKARMVLLTTDLGFWDDKLHPCDDAAGILILHVPPQHLGETLARFYRGFLKVFKNDDWIGAKARVGPTGFMFKRRRWPSPRRFQWRAGYYEEVNSGQSQG